jgi:hypothetical protein
MRVWRHRVDLTHPRKGWSVGSYERCNELLVATKERNFLSSWVATDHWRRILLRGFRTVFGRLGCDIYLRTYPDTNTYIKVDKSDFATKPTVFWLCVATNYKTGKVTCKSDSLYANPFHYTQTAINNNEWWILMDISIFHTVQDTCNATAGSESDMPEVWKPLEILFWNIILWNQSKSLNVTACILPNSNGIQQTQRVQTYSIKCCSNPCSITTVPGEDLCSRSWDGGNGYSSRNHAWHYAFQ